MIELKINVKSLFDSLFFMLKIKLTSIFLLLVYWAIPHILFSQSIPEVTAYSVEFLLYVILPANVN